MLDETRDGQDPFWEDLALIMDAWGHHLAEEMDGIRDAQERRMPGKALLHLKRIRKYTDVLIPSGDGPKRVDPGI